MSLSNRHHFRLCQYWSGWILTFTVFLLQFPSSDLTPVTQAQASPPSGQVDIPQEPSSPEHSQALAIQLYLLAAQLNQNESFVLSPDSLFQGVSLIGMGAAGDTASVISKCLGGTYQPLSSTEDTQGQAEVYSVANCILLGAGLSLQPTYQQAVAGMNSQIHDQVPFSDSSLLTNTIQEVNAQFSELTHGLISSACNPQGWDPSVRLVLINGAYFSGAWEYPFQTTGDREFVLSSGESVTVECVCESLPSTGTRYAQEGGWQAVTVPYQDAYEMVFILPPQGTPPFAIEQPFLTDLLSQLQPQAIHLTFPPFETTTQSDQAQYLSKLGLESLFSDVNLGNMLVGLTEGIFLSEVRQNAAIRVTAQGTEAGATTEFEFSRGGLPQGVTLNRPFLYILRHRKSGRVPFIGQLHDPRSSQQ